MSQTTAQLVVAASMCLVLVVFILRLSRTERLSFRYTIGWLGLFSLGVIATIALPITNKISEWLRISPAALLALCGILILVMICIQLSVSISGMQRQIRRLAEEQAKVQMEMRSKTNSHAD